MNAPWIIPPSLAWAIPVLVVFWSISSHLAAPADVHRTLPAGWHQVGGGDTSSYVIGLDLNHRHSGHSSGHIRSLKANVQGFVGLAQGIRGDSYRGKRVRYTAWVRTVDAERAGLWLRIDGSDAVLGFDNMMDRPVSGTTGWARYRIVLDVPSHSIGMTFGIILGGEGEVWIDDAQLEVVGPEVPVTQPPRPIRSGIALPDSVQRRYALRPATPMNLGFEE